MAAVLLLSGCFTGVFGPHSNREAPDPDPYVPQHEAYLLRDRYHEILVEIDYVPGNHPSALALDAFNATFQRYTGKTIRTVFSPIADGDGEYSNDELDRLELRHRDHGFRGRFGSGSTAYLHVLYLNGFPEKRDALAAKLGSGAIVVFLDMLDYTPGPVYLFNTGLAQDKNERSALIHEVGHTFGLVNCGLPMIRAREDPASPCHSTDVTLMGRHEETSPTKDAGRWVDEWQNGPTWKFDVYDEQDIRGFQESEKKRATD